MDKPKCRLCGHKHWGDEHVWPEDEDKAKERKEMTDRIVKEAEVQRKEENEKKKFDRVAYQREYMRKRRAKT